MVVFVAHRMARLFDAGDRRHEGGEQAERMLEQCHAVLKPGGLLILQYLSCHKTKNFFLLLAYQKVFALYLLFLFFLP